MVSGTVNVSIARLPLITTIIATLAYSWAPFELRLRHLDLEHLGPVFQPVHTVGQLLDLAPHFLLFTCLGALVVFSGRRELGIRTSFVWLACLALMVETVQLFMSGRHAQVFDAFAHLSGALAGILVGRRLQPHLSSPTRWPRWERFVHIGVFSVATMAWILAVWLPILGTYSLGTWDRSFPLMIANEDGGGRAWLGEIRYVALYDRALGPPEARWCFTTIGDSDPARDREPIGLLAGYDFTLPKGRSISPEPASPAVLDVNDSNQIYQGRGSGLVLARPTSISTNGPVPDLTDRLSQHGAFAVEAWGRPKDLTQSGPARIVSLSSGPWRRNFTLAQERRNLVFRVRNGISGPNGTKFELEARAVLTEGLHHIVASYDHGVSALFLDGRAISPVRDLRAPGLILGLGDRPQSEVAVALLCLFPLAVSARALLNTRHQLLVALPVVILLGVSPQLVPDPVNAEATHWVRLGCFVLAFCAAAVLSRLCGPSQGSDTSLCKPRMERGF